MSKLLSARQVADVLGIARGSVYRLVHRGQLPPPVKVGSASRWRTADVEKIVNARGKLARPKRKGEPKGRLADHASDTAA